MGAPDELERLAALHAAGSLSDAEYEVAKQAALAAGASSDQVVAPLSNESPVSDAATVHAVPSAASFKDASGGQPPAWQRLDRRAKAIVGAVGLALVLIVVLIIANSGGGGGDESAGGGAPSSQSTNEAAETTSTDGPTTTTSTTSVPVQATEKVIFTPFTSGGLASGLSVVASVGGRCQPSNVLSRSDAFRCFVDGELPNGGNIADPCFSDGFGTREDLICVGAPDQTEVVSLTPDSRPFSGSDSSGEGPPWYLKLESGQVCGFAGGATASIGDRRLNYFCDDDTEVYGEPDTSGPRWRIFVSDGSSTELSEVAIDIAWY